MKITNREILNIGYNRELNKKLRQYVVYFSLAVALVVTGLMFAIFSMDYNTDIQKTIVVNVVLNNIGVALCMVGLVGCVVTFILSTNYAENHKYKYLNEAIKDNKLEIDLEKE